MRYLLPPSTMRVPAMPWVRTLVGVVGTDALGKIVVLTSSPILAAILRPEEFGNYVLLQAIWAVVMLAQFGGSDWTLPLRAGEPGADRNEVFSVCSVIAVRALPLVWLVSAALVLIIRPGGSLSTADYSLFMAGLLPAGYATWQLFLLRFARRSDEFAAGTLGLKTMAPLLALAGGILWPVRDQRLTAFLGVALVTYCIAAGYAHRLRRSAVPLEALPISHSKIRPFLVTGATLLPGGLAYAAIWSSDRIVANALWGPQAAGIVGVAALLGSSVLLMKVWLSLMWEPLVVEWAGKQLGRELIRRIQRGFDWTALSFLSIATLGVIWGPWAVRALYPSELSRAAELLPWYFAAAAISGIAGIASVTILLARAPGMHLAVQMAALAVCALTMAVAAPHIGLAGVVAGVLAAEMTLLSSWLFLGKRYFRNLPLRLDRVIVMAGVFASIGWGCAHLRSDGVGVEMIATALVTTAVGISSFALATHQREVQIA